VRRDTPSLAASSPASRAAASEASESAVRADDALSNAEQPSSALDGAKEKRAEPKGGTRSRRTAGAEPAAAPRASDAAARRPARARRVPPPVASGAAGRTEWVRSSSLGEETRLMERAMVALGEGDRELARRSLDEHARRFPGGLLQRERERALLRLRQADAEQTATHSSR
jgi:hypothetical protein